MERVEAGGGCDGVHPLHGRDGEELVMQAITVLEQPIASSADPGHPDSPSSTALVPARCVTKSCGILRHVMDGRGCLGVFGSGQGML